MKDLIKNKRWLTAALIVLSIIVVIYSILGCILEFFTDWDDQIPFFNIWFNLSAQNFLILLIGFLIYLSSFFVDLDRIFKELDNDYFDFKHRITKDRFPFSMYGVVLLFIVGFNLEFNIRIFNNKNNLTISVKERKRIRYF